MALVSIAESPIHRYAGLGNVLLAVYTGTPGADVLRSRVAWVERALERHGAIGQLVVVARDASGSLPGREFREVSRAQADRWRGRILFSASVIEGRGVHHALIRTFLRGLALVAGKDVPVRFFDDVGPAAAFAESLAGHRGGPSASDIVAAIDSLRRPPSG